MNNPVHNHPKMEERLGLDEDHVIIDKELYHEFLILSSELAIVVAAHFSKVKVSNISSKLKISLYL